MVVVEGAGAADVVGGAVVGGAGTEVEDLVGEGAALDVVLVVGGDVGGW